MRRPLAYLAISALVLPAATSAGATGFPWFSRSTPEAAAPADGGFAEIGYATWSNEDPPYLLYEGDELQLTLPTAPENNTTLTVGHDGRVSLPLVGEIMAAGRSVADVRAEAAQRYATQLRRPIVDLAVKAAPLTVYVGGEVGNPAAVSMIGDENALQAVIQAGGFKTSADRARVVIIRRGPNGTAMMRTANLTQALHHGQQPDLVPLARGDVIFVPRSGIANIGLFMQQYFRDALPISFSYAINGFTGG